MKTIVKILVGIAWVAAAGTLLWFLFTRGCVDYVQHTHCGYAADKYISNPYEHRVGKTVNTEESKLYIVFKPDTCPYVRIEVNTNTFYSTKVGDRVCFDLCDYDIQNGKK